MPRSINRARKFSQSMKKAPLAKLLSRYGLPEDSGGPVTRPEDNLRDVSAVLAAASSRITNALLLDRHMPAARTGDDVVLSNANGYLRSKFPQASPGDRLVYWGIEFEYNGTNWVPAPERDQ